MEKKHLVYAEDVVYEIMQHPSKNITKGLVKQLVDKVVEEKEVHNSDEKICVCIQK